MDFQPEMPPTPSPTAPVEDEATQVQMNADLLRQFLQEHQANGTQMDRTIRQHLQGGVTLETWGHILHGLTTYTGEDIATFVLTVLLRSDDVDFLLLVEESTPAEVWSYLRSLMALYSAHLQEAYAVFGENPQGWRTINRRIYYDYLTDSWRANFEIIKFNGEQFNLDETPTSAIVLCQAILDALTAVPAELAQQAVDPDAVDNLIGLFHTFVERFATDNLQAEEEA
jgi:hypothetical protein